MGIQVEAGARHDVRAAAWSTVGRIGERVRVAERRAFWIGMLGCMGVAVLFASTRPLWFDEIFTWEIARRPSVGELIAVLGPMDPNPPLHYLLVRGVHALFGTGPLATRTPALAFFFLTLILVRRLVLPVAGPLFSLVAVAALMLTPVLDLAAEARPYAFLVASAASALLAWRAITSGKRRRLGIAALVGTLTAALYAHFYGFLLFVPIAAGETVRSWVRRRFDVGVWAPLAFAAVLALPLLPLVRKCLAVRATFWAAPTLLGLVLSLRMFQGLALVALMATVLDLIARGGSSDTETAPEAPCAPAPLHEVAAALALAFLPLVGFLVASLATNAYDARYVVPSVLGVILLLAHGSRWLRHRRTQIAIILLAAVCPLVGARAILGVTRAPDEPGSMVPLPLPDHGPRFVVVASPLTFVQTLHAAPGTTDRLVYLIDGLAQSDKPRSSPDISVLGLSALLPLRVEDLETFVAAHDSFWVFDQTGRLDERLRAERNGVAGGRAAERGALQLWSR